MQTSSPSEAGFTLIEMLAVLAVMSLVVLLALPRMTMPSRPETSAAARLTRSIHDARDRAMSSGNLVRLNPSTVVSAANLSHPTGQAELIFYPDGTSTGGDIMVRGRAVLRVDWLTGRAHAPI